MIEGEKHKIFLMPGLDGTGELFAPLLSVMDMDVAVVRYENERTLDDYVATVAALLPDKNAVLIAESFSGPIALALMARYPGRIKCCVLCATFAVSPFRVLAGLARFVPAMFFELNAIQNIVLKKFCFDQISDPKLIEKAQSVVNKLPASIIKSRLKVLAGLDLRPILSDIKIPVLYLQALQDKVVGKRFGMELVNNLPNAVIKEINGPHMLLQSRPRECAGLIQSFIEP